MDTITISGIAAVAGLVGTLIGSYVGVTTIRRGKKADEENEREKLVLLVKTSVQAELDGRVENAIVLSERALREEARTGLQSERAERAEGKDDAQSKLTAASKDLDASINRVSARLDGFVSEFHDLVRDVANIRGIQGALGENVKALQSELERVRDAKNGKA